MDELIRLVDQREKGKISHCECVARLKEAWEAAPEWEREQLNRMIRRGEERLKDEKITD